MLSLTGITESVLATVSIFDNVSTPCARHKKKEKEISISKKHFTNAAKLSVETGVPKNSLQNRNEFLIDEDLIAHHYVCQ